MARPPVIISNGGVIGELTDGLTYSGPGTLEDKVKANIKKLRSTAVMKVIKAKKQKDATILYWRLNSEKKYEEVEDANGHKKYKDGTELVQITDLFFSDNTP